MAPPPHVRAVTAVCCAFMLAMGLRDAIRPGLIVPGWEGDKQIMEHILDGADASDLSPRHKFMFQIWGMVLISYTLGKAYTVLGHQEGTFLRQQLMGVYSGMDMWMAHQLWMYEGLPRKALLPHMVLLFANGLILFYDVLTRERNAKPLRGSYARAEGARMKDN